jgi:hypothetical protein
MHKAEVFDVDVAEESSPISILLIWWYNKSPGLENRKHVARNYPGTGVGLRSSEAPTVG